MTGGLDSGVERRLYFLPKGITIGPDDHTPLYGRIISQLGFDDDIGVPARKILALINDRFDELSFLLHG
jgi:hypothetical protein